jgi:hypothetical protein
MHSKSISLCWHHWFSRKLGQLHKLRIQTEFDWRYCKCTQSTSHLPHSSQWRQIYFICGCWSVDKIECAWSNSLGSIHNFGHVRRGSVQDAVGTNDSSCIGRSIRIWLFGTLTLLFLATKQATVRIRAQRVTLQYRPKNKSSFPGF